MTSISQVQTQKLMQKLSPQQIQMIKLLELPTIQLEQRIKREIEENPALEEVVDSEEREEKNINIDEYARKEDQPAYYKLNINNYSKDEKIKSIPLSSGSTLNEFLNEQISFKQAGESTKEIARYLVGCLDSSGYLRRDTQDIIDDILFTTGHEITTEEMDQAVELVQSLEPHGICARNLQEALILQLKHHPQTPEVKAALSILEDHFELFVKKHYDKIIHKLGISDEMLKGALTTIVNLSPKPANLYSNEGGQSEPTIQIIPDFILDTSKGYTELILNQYNTPEVKVNAHYLKMLEEIIKENKKAAALEKRGGKGDVEAANFIKQKIDSAKWFITAIKQRNATLLLTMNTILDIQKDYFETGDETSLKPMILKDIADRTGLDVSTISRVVNSKYIQTDFGVYSLKFFFSEAMKTVDGEEVSSREIKKILSDCIDQEDKSKPLTDEALMNILQEKGYQIARRTVAKYREMLNIPVARLRKEW